MDHHFHGVAQWGVFHKFDGSIGDEAHVQEMLAALAFTIDSLDAGGLTDV